MGARLVDQTGPFEQRLATLLTRVKGPSVLHIGCAGGHMDELPPVDSPLWLHGHLVREHPDVWGIDISAEKIAFLERRGFRHVYVADAESFDLSKRFDTIVAGAIIEHLTNPGTFLKTAVRHLKPDGRLLITTPYAFGFFHFLYALVRYPKTCSHPEHTMWFCPQTLRFLAGLCGLEVSDLKLVELYVPFPHRPLYTLFYRLYPFIRLFLPERLRATTMVVTLRSTVVGGRG